MKVKVVIYTGQKVIAEGFLTTPKLSKVIQHVQESDDQVILGHLFDCERAINAETQLRCHMEVIEA